MLAEFKYGLEPKETFAQFVDQAKPNRLADASYRFIDSILKPLLAGYSIILRR